MKRCFAALLVLLLLFSLLPAALAAELPLVDAAEERGMQLWVEEQSTAGLALRWTAAQAAEEYQVQRCCEGEDWLTLGVTPACAYTDAAAQMGRRYLYRVRALAAGEETGDGAQLEQLFNPFSDVSGKKTVEYLGWAYNNAIVTGTSASSFAPEATCTRVQFIMMLWKMNGSPEATGTNPFRDIKGAKTTRAILWALEAGVINSGPSFDPDGNISRVQIVMILWKMAGSPAAEGDNPFRDVSGKKTTQAVLWAYQNGITKGTSAGTFAPNADCTRAQLVVFLYKYNQLTPVITAPTLKLCACEKAMSLSWSEVPGAEQYYVYVQKDAGGFGRYLAAKVNHCVYTGAYGHVYTFRVVPVIGGKPGQSSKDLAFPLIKTPDQPELRALTREDGALTVTWYTLSGATEAEIYARPCGSEGWALAGTAKAADKSFTWAGAAADRDYELRLRGVNAAELGTAYGPWSEPESTEPILLTVKPGYSSESSPLRLELSWTRPSDCGSFCVYAREYYSSGEYELLGVTEGTDFVYDAAKYSTSYAFRVTRSEEALRRPPKKSEPVKGDSGSWEQLNYQRVLSLPSYLVHEDFLASRTDGILFVGDDLWYLKSAASTRSGMDEGYYPMVLFRVPDFASPEGWRAAQDPEVYVLHDAEGRLYCGMHSSSIAYDPGEDCFYLVSCGGRFENGADYSDCPIVKVDREGLVLAAVPAEGFQTDMLSTLAYAGASEEGCPLFWARDGKRKAEAGEYHKFSLGKLVDGRLVCVKTCISEDLFSMAGYDGIPHSNDIHYEDGKLYHSVFIYDDEDKHITKNWVYVLDLEHPVGLDNGMEVVPTLFVGRYDHSGYNSSEEEFEVEGLAVWNGQLYLGVNTTGVDDGLFRVKDCPYPDAFELIAIS